MAAQKPIITLSKLLATTSPIDAQLKAPASSSEGPEENSAASRFSVDQVILKPDSRIVMVTDPRSPGADRLRYLRLRLQELRGLSKLKTLSITSALPKDGKSTVALNLAVALSEGGKRRVLIIEGDLHQPALSMILDVPRREGLAECLEENSDPLSCISFLDPLGIHLLQAGKAHANPTELLQSSALSVVLEKLSSSFEWILIDTPPVVPLTDAITLSRLSDGTLFVVRADQTPRQAVDEAISQVGQRNIVGIVVNGVQELNDNYYKYAKYYGKGPQS